MTRFGIEEALSVVGTDPLAVAFHQLEKKNLFPATNVAQTKPMHGKGTYKEMLQLRRPNISLTEAMNLRTMLLELVQDVAVVLRNHIRLDVCKQILLVDFQQLLQVHTVEALAWKEACAPSFGRGRRLTCSLRAVTHRLRLVLIHHLSQLLFKPLVEAVWRVRPSLTVSTLPETRTTLGLQCDYKLGSSTVNSAQCRRRRCATTSILACAGTLESHETFGFLAHERNFMHEGGIVGVEAYDIPR